MNKKLLTTVLALTLIFSGGVALQAAEFDYDPVMKTGVDIGYLQGFGGDNSLRLDVNNFLFSIPLEGETINQFNVGAKLPTPLGDLYGGPYVNFADSAGEDDEFGLDKGGLLFGYPIKWGPVTIRGEFQVDSPKWSNPDTYDGQIKLGGQLNFGYLFT